MSKFELVHIKGFLFLEVISDPISNQDMVADIRKTHTDIDIPFPIQQTSQNVDVIQDITQPSSTNQLQKRTSKTCKC